MEGLGALLLPLHGMLVHRRVTPQRYAAGTYLYNWVKGDKEEKKFLKQRDRKAQTGPKDPKVKLFTASPPYRGRGLWHF